MGLIAHALERVKPSPTMAITSKAREMKAAGCDVIGLGAGEPDFDTPDNVKQAAIAAIKRGETKYTAVDGIPELKRAIVAKFKRENGLAYKPSEITVGSGGKQVLYNALMATLNPGDEVIVPSPYWVSYPDIVLLAGAQAGDRRDEARGRLQAEPEGARRRDHAEDQMVHLQFAVEPDRRRLYARRDQGADRRAAEAPHVWVLTDDMYEHLVYDGFKFSTPAQVEPKL